jgi:hypothetical protein
MPRLSKIGSAALAAFGWTTGASVSVDYLVVAGGGGRGNRDDYYAGGGGAGGLLTGTASLNPTLPLYDYCSRRWSKRRKRLKFSFIRYWNYYCNCCWRR